MFLKLHLRSKKLLLCFSYKQHIGHFPKNVYRFLTIFAKCSTLDVNRELNTYLQLQFYLLTTTLQRDMTFDAVFIIL